MLRDRRLHPAQPVFWCHSQAGVPPPWCGQAVHEAILLCKQLCWPNHHLLIWDSLIYVGTISYFQTIQKVLLAYADLVRRDFEKYTGKPAVVRAWFLFNAIWWIIVSVIICICLLRLASWWTIFSNCEYSLRRLSKPWAVKRWPSLCTLGSVDVPHVFPQCMYFYLLQLDPDAADVLNTLQQTLNSVLDDLSSIFARRWAFMTLSFTAKTHRHIWSCLSPSQPWCSDQAEHPGTGSTPCQGQGCWAGLAQSAVSTQQHPAGFRYHPATPHGFPGRKVGSHCNHNADGLWWLCLQERDYAVWLLNVVLLTCIHYNSILSCFSLTMFAQACDKTVLKRLLKVCPSLAFHHISTRYLSAYSYILASNVISSGIVENGHPYIGENCCSATSDWSKTGEIWSSILSHWLPLHKY